MPMVIFFLNIDEIIHIGTQMYLTWFNKFSFIHLCINYHKIFIFNSYKIRVFIYISKKLKCKITINTLSFINENI